MLGAASVLVEHARWWVSVGGGFSHSGRLQEEGEQGGGGSETPLWSPHRCLENKNEPKKKMPPACRRS